MPTATILDNNAQVDPRTNPREFCISAKDAVVTKLTVEGCDAVVYVWEAIRFSLGVEKKVLLGKGFAGKSNKHRFFHNFPSEAYRSEFIAKFFEAEAKTAAYKAEMKAKDDAEKASMNAASDYPVGSVVYTSGGYDQTNVQFYEVVGHYGRIGVILVEVNSTLTDKPSSSMSGYVLPVKAAEGAPQIKARMVAGKRISIPGAYHVGSLHDGTPRYCSWYA